jgi:hypothetical protein
MESIATDLQVNKPKEDMKITLSQINIPMAIRKMFSGNWLDNKDNLRVKFSLVLTIGYCELQKDRTGPLKGTVSGLSKGMS